MSAVSIPSHGAKAPTWWGGATDTSQPQATHSPAQSEQQDVPIDEADGTWLDPLPTASRELVCRPSPVL